jgi:hypothetical protein
MWLRLVRGLHGRIIIIWYGMFYWWFSSYRIFNMLQLFLIDHVLFTLIEYASNKHCISLSFSAIFSQAIKMLGCRWHSGGFDHTSLDDKWRDHVKFHTEPYSTTVFTIYEKSNWSSFELRESALINALVYIDEVLSYNIRGINYVRYLMRRSEMWLILFVILAMLSIEVWTCDACYIWDFKWWCMNL